VSHSLDFGKGRLRALVSATTDTLPRLPLVHSTDSYVFEDVLADGAIAPRACNVFKGEALTYFFYGRPAFRPNLDAEPTGLKHYFPVCLLLKPDWTASVKRVFPFDSGAFHNSFYSAYLHDKMKLGDFGLEADMSSPGKVVSIFFGSNPAYLVGKPRAEPKIDPSEFEAHSYLALVHAKHSNAIDNRGSGIEVQTAEIVSIADAVAAVIIPSTFADGRTGERLKKLGIDILPYSTFERYRPSEYMSKITELCLTYYVHIGLVNEGEL
jgi:hypothetical protein